MGEIYAIDAYGPLLDRTQAIDGFGQLALPVPGNPCNAQDFPFANG